MTKLAFMFPGQGSFEAGMGRDVAEAVPEAMAVYEAGSEASGLDLKRLCFESPVEQLVETEVQQPALVATSLAFNAALRARGINPDFVVGHSVGEFAALAAAGSFPDAQAIGLVRERGLAMAAAAKESPGSMAAILGLEGRGRRGALQEDLARLAGELQLPGAGRRSRAPTRRSPRPARRPSAKARSARSGFAFRARSTRRSSSAPPTGCGRRSTASSSTSRRRRSCRR